MNQPGALALDTSQQPYTPHSGRQLFTDCQHVLLDPRRHTPANLRNNSQERSQRSPGLRCQLARNPQVLDMTAPRANYRRLPRSPLLDWSSFSREEKTPSTHSMDDVRHAVITTSGRAAIYQALLQLGLAPGSVVLAPTYHCPTMIAPIIVANLEVAYFAIRPDGLPNLDSIDSATAAKAKAIIVSHYFGLARSLSEVRRWCDEHRVALIEDCAHCYFGDAGERPIGTWGDFSTASLSKFFPVVEGGILASNKIPIAELRLSPPSLKSQVQAGIDVVELAIKFGGFAGIHAPLAYLFRIKNSLLHSETSTGNSEAPAAASMMQTCDMGRVSRAPTYVCIKLKSLLPRGQMIARRRRNAALYARHFENVQGARALFPWHYPDAVPYVFPLWVEEEPDRVYQTLRAMDLPVFRWDTIWPDTPHLRDDVGPDWSHHVLQLLCHQSLSETDITRTALATLSLLSKAQAPALIPVQLQLDKN